MAYDFRECLMNRVHHPGICVDLGNAQLRRTNITRWRHLTPRDYRDLRAALTLPVRRPAHACDSAGTRNVSCHWQGKRKKQKLLVSCINYERHMQMWRLHVTFSLVQRASRLLYGREGKNSHSSHLRADLCRKTWFPSAKHSQLRYAAKQIIRISCYKCSFGDNKYCTKNQNFALGGKRNIEILSINKEI